MVHASVIDLISLSPSSGGKFDARTETSRTVCCEVKSVGMNEAYLAMAQQLNPEYRFVLADYAEYQGEPKLEYNGVRYDIIRTYINGETIELTAARCK